MKKTTQSLLFLLLAFSLVACAGKSEFKAPSIKITEPAKTEETKSPAKKSTPTKPATTTKIKSGSEDLIIIGETEHITIKPDNIRLKARIDTGATTSSIHATQIKPYERDGKKWVRFNLTRTNGETVEIKKPVLRTIEVKRHGAEQQSRPVISLPIVMGKINETTQFSLTDRSQFKFPVLIGRSFLKNTAIVDVNRSYALSPLNEEKKP